MRRSVALVGLALASLMVVFGVMRPSPVKGAGGILNGLTHLLVKENDVLQLKTSVQTNSPFLGTEMALHNRDGSSGGTYVVPAGKVFVVTDFQFTYVQPTGQSVSLIRSELNDFQCLSYFPQPISTSQRPSENLHFSGGIVYDEGSKVTVFGYAPPPVAGEFTTFQFTVLGYETNLIP